MGSYLSRTQSSVSLQITPFIPYIVSSVDHELTVDPTVELVIKPSDLASAFLEDRNMGLFTRKPITKGTIVYTVPTNEECKMNDGLVDLEPILRATNSTEMYEVWTNLKNSYYDLEKVKRVVNVRMVTDKNGKCYYEAIQDIPADAELLRMYGFTTWPFELFDVLTNKHIIGFIYFINDLAKDVAGDPYEAKIMKLNENLEQYRKGDLLLQLSPSEFDKRMEDTETIYIRQNDQRLL